MPKNAAQIELHSVAKENAVVSAPQGLELIYKIQVHDGGAVDAQKLLRIEAGL